MKTSEFLGALVPSEGVLFAAVPASFEKNGKTINYYRHTACYSPEELALTCKSASHHGDNAFFALASYEAESYIDERTGRKKQRTQKNAFAAKCMWLDIDCGVGKPYANQREGAAALVASVKKAKLPQPTFVVNSGNGLHAYWAFTKPVDRLTWLKVAKRFKALMDATGLAADKVTANIACVLRPIGCINYKHGQRKEVKLIKEGRPVRFSDWVRAVASATKALKVPAPAPEPVPNLNAALGGGMNDYPPSDADKIADRCLVLGEMRDLKGAGQDEQQWYNSIGILKYTEQGEAVVQDWSSGHDGYDSTITTDKMNQWEYGPTRCDTMRELFSACADCTLKCNSPISLGFPDPEHQTEVETVDEQTQEAVVETLPTLPDPVKEEFSWVEGKGLMARIEDNDGNVFHVVVCSQFPVPEFIFYDKLAEAYFVRISSRTAPFTWQAGDLPLGTVQRGGSNLIDLMGNKCAVTVKDEGKLLVKYMKTWVDIVRQSTDLQTMRDQMGWQRDDSFLLGKTLYKPDGTKKDVVVARGLSRYAEAHTPKGDRQTFVDTIDQLYNRPNYQEYQFFWLASFGSVLLRFLHSHNMGITLAAYSPDSGTGKTSVCKAAIANFGDPGGFGQQADGQDGATEYAITVMAGLRHNLPILIDEITGWDSGRLGKFLYRVCSGTGKVQGSADGGLRDNSSYNWNAVSFLTSNAPMSSKLASETRNSQAQLARLFDVQFESKGFDPSDARLFEQLWQHCGTTGAEFIEYITPRQEKVSKLCNAMLTKLNKKAKATQSARYWMMLAAATMTAAHLTKRLNMHDFDVEALEEWTLERINEIKVTAEQSVEAVEDITRAMLSELQSGMVVTVEEPKKIKDFTPFAPGYGAPRQSVTGRYIVSSGDMFIPTATVRAWCASHNTDYNELRKRLLKQGWLATTDLRYDVGRGTSVSSTRVRCWKLNFEDVSHILKVVTPDDSGAEDGTQLQK